MSEYIERGAVICLLQGWIQDVNENPIMLEDEAEYGFSEESEQAEMTASILGDAIDGITDIPAADVEPVVRGEWREFDADMNAYVCSVCDEPYVLIDGTPEQNHYNYCPNCGAHMERSGSGE